MQILGDTNATLLDLTIVAEAALEEQITPIYPILCSDIKAADEAYVKIPIQTKSAFPVLFDGEREDTSTEVTVVQQYNKATYALTLEFNADLVKESKAYSFSEKTEEAAISAKIFPNYNLSANIIIKNPTAYDGKAFYSTAGSTGTRHLWANAGANFFYNAITQTGTTVTQLWADLQTAVATMMSILDDKGRLLNPQLEYGEKNLVIHCPVALMAAFRQLLHGSMIAISAPVTTSGTAAVGASGPSTIPQFQAIARLIPDGYLDVNSTSRWYLHYVGRPQKPFVFSESYGLEAFALGFGTEYQRIHNKVMIGTQHRFVEGVYRTDRSIKIG
jgi:hypothetical protein